MCEHFRRDAFPRDVVDRDQRMSRRHAVRVIGLRARRELHLAQSAVAGRRLADVLSRSITAAIPVKADGDGVPSEL